MANAVTKKHATPHRLTYLVVGDGTVDTVRTSAELLADMVDGPLKDLFNAAYADQPAMRGALLEEHCEIRIRPRTAVAGLTAEVSSWSADVDADAVSATKAELNLKCPDQAAAEAYVDIIARHSIVD